MLHRQVRRWTFLVSWSLLAVWAGQEPMVFAQGTKEAKAAKSANSPQEALVV